MSPRSARVLAVAVAAGITWLIATVARPGTPDSDPLHPLGPGRPMHRARSESASRESPLFWLHLEGGRTYQFETRNLSKATDTVLTLYQGTSGPVAQNDDREGLPGGTVQGRNSSSIVYQVGLGGPYALVVSARPGSLEGTCDLYVDGKPLAKNLAVGRPFREQKPRSMGRPGAVYPKRPLPEAPLYELPRPQTAPPPPPPPGHAR